jgi:hypothetical protein
MAFFTLGFLPLPLFLLPLLWFLSQLRLLLFQLLSPFSALASNLTASLCLPLRPYQPANTALNALYALLSAL